MPRPFLLLPLLLIAAAATPIQPGKWRTTVTITDMAMPGLPPGVADAMRRKPTVVTACVTPADAAAGPRAVTEKSNGRCRYTDYKMSGGRISSTMQCTGPRGAMTVRSTGAYTPTTLAVDGAANAAGGMTMKTRTVSQRIGGC